MAFTDWGEEPGWFGLALVVDGKGETKIVSTKTGEQLDGVKSIDYAQRIDESDTITIEVYTAKLMPRAPDHPHLLPPIEPGGG